MVCSHTKLSLINCTLLHKGIVLAIDPCIKARADTTGTAPSALLIIFITKSEGQVSKLMRDHTSIDPALIENNMASQIAKTSSAKEKRDGGSAVFRIDPDVCFILTGSAGSDPNRTEACLTVGGVADDVVGCDECVLDIGDIRSSRYIPEIDAEVHRTISVDPSTPCIGNRHHAAAKECQEANFEIGFHSCWI
jgi:hypothetical protein